MDEQHERFLRAAREVQDAQGFAEAKDIMARLDMDINAPADRAVYREIMPALGRSGHVGCQGSDRTGLPCGLLKLIT